MRPLLHSVLQNLVRTGGLTVHWPDGGTAYYGSTAGPQAALRLRDANTVRRVALDPGLRFGEAYMDGGLIPVGGTIYDVLDVLLLNIGRRHSHPIMDAWEQLRSWTRVLRQRNQPVRARPPDSHRQPQNSPRAVRFGGPASGGDGLAGQQCASPSVATRHGLARNIKSKPIPFIP